LREFRAMEGQSQTMNVPISQQRRRSTVANIRRRHMSKAKKRAEEAEETFLSGADALTEVAKEDGRWNWVLVGPDPSSLPLSGGGSRSVEEMRGAFTNHAHSFGLLRMTFGVDADAITKFLFIHAADESDSGNFSRMERGQAAAMEPQMENAIRQFAPHSAKIVLRSQEECTVENLVAKLRSVVGNLDLELITVEHFHAAVMRWEEEHPELLALEKKKKQHFDILHNMAAPKSKEAAPELEKSEAPQEEPSRQRRKVKLFAKGDVCEVFSVKHGKWFLDGEITDAITESSYRDGLRVVAGSMKATYDNGVRFKWVAPHEVEALVRESPRPRPPEPLVGELTKQQVFWFLTRWTKMHCELNKGFLQWWYTEEDAKSGAQPLGSSYMLGLQQQDEDVSFKLRTESSEGEVLSFIAASTEEVSTWVEALWVHAGYCEEVCEFYEAKLGGLMVRKELMSVMMHRELKSVGERRKTVPAKMGTASETA